MAAIVPEPIVLLLGGRDKDLPWADLASLVHAGVVHVVLFGRRAPKSRPAFGPRSGMTRT